MDLRSIVLEALTIYTYLASFLSAYRFKSVSKGAKYLKMTQPSVSGHIRHLEDHLGGRLFVRHGRGIEPTELAHKLASDLNPHWGKLEKVVDQYFPPPGSELQSPLTRLGCTSEIFEFLLFPEFKPGTIEPMNLELIFSHTGILFEKLLSDEIDILITSFRMDSHELIRDEFFTTKQVLIGNPAWKKTFDQTDQHNIDFESIPWGAYFSQKAILKNYLKVSCKSEATLTPKVVVNDARILMMYAQRGDVVAVIPEFILKKFSASKDICQIHFPDSYPEGCLFSYIKSSSPEVSIRKKQVAEWKDLVRKSHR